MGKNNNKKTSVDLKIQDIKAKIASAKDTNSLNSISSEINALELLADSIGINVSNIIAALIKSLEAKKEIIAEINANVTDALNSNTEALNSKDKIQDKTTADVKQNPYHSMSTNEIDKAMDQNFEECKVLYKEINEAIDKSMQKDEIKESDLSGIVTSINGKEKLVDDRLLALEVQIQRVKESEDAVQQFNSAIDNIPDGQKKDDFIAAREKEKALLKQKQQSLEKTFNSLRVVYKKNKKSSKKLDAMEKSGKIKTKAAQEKFKETRKMKNTAGKIENGIKTFNEKYNLKLDLEQEPEQEKSKDGFRKYLTKNIQYSTSYSTSPPPRIVKTPSKQPGRGI